jgi:MinD superfamily P-loop ATPase
MKEIVILSGKGGTGKTSIAASFAVLAGNDAVIADCDVDAANMHLLLKPDFGKKSEFYSGELALIKQELCTECGKCEEICRFDAISYINNQYQINSLNCEGCGYCEKICPSHAITMQEQISGNLYISKTRLGSTMIHAKLNIGAENSGKLVAKVKSEAKSTASEEGKSYIIVDGSPGIGCPVVSSLAGANFVVLVTEPSVSGLHDLKRIYVLIKKFRIKAACIINKYDMNIEKTIEIKSFLKEENIVHLADIPYDINFTKTMIESKTIVEKQSPIKKTVENIWEKIKKQLIIN